MMMLAIDQAADLLGRTTLGHGSDYFAKKLRYFLRAGAIWPDGYQAHRRGKGTLSQIEVCWAVLSLTLNDLGFSGPMIARLRSQVFGPIGTGTSFPTAMRQMKAGLPVLAVIYGDRRIRIDFAQAITPDLVGRFGGHMTVLDCRVLLVPLLRLWDQEEALAQAAESLHRTQIHHQAGSAPGDDG